MEYGGTPLFQRRKLLVLALFLFGCVWFECFYPVQAIVFKVSHVSVVFSKSEFLGQALLHLCSLIVPRATVPVLNILLGLAIPLWAWERAPGTKPAAVRLVGWRAVLTLGPGGHTSLMAETLKAEEELLALFHAC